MALFLVAAVTQLVVEVAEVAVVFLFWVEKHILILMNAWWW